MPQETIIQDGVTKVFRDHLRGLKYATVSCPDRLKLENEARSMEYVFYGYSGRAGQVEYNPATRMFSFEFSYSRSCE